MTNQWMKRSYEMTDTLDAPTHRFNRNKRNEDAAVTTVRDEESNDVGKNNNDDEDDDDEDFVRNVLTQRDRLSGSSGERKTSAADEGGSTTKKRKRRRSVVVEEERDASTTETNQQQQQRRRGTAAAKGNKQAKKNTTQWENLAEITDDEDNSGTNGVPTTKSSNAAEVDNVWKSVSEMWFDVNNVRRRNERNEQFRRQRPRRYFMEEFDATDDLYSRSCWSLLMRLDPVLCAKSFQISNTKFDSLKMLISQIRTDLLKLYDFGKRVGIDFKFSLPEREAQSRYRTLRAKHGAVKDESDDCEAIDESAESAKRTDTAEKQRDDIVVKTSTSSSMNAAFATASTSSLDGTTFAKQPDVASSRRANDAYETVDPEEEIDFTEMRDNKELADKYAVESAMDLDACIGVLCKLAVSRSDRRALNDLEDCNHFASVNSIFTGAHLNYMCSRIHYTGSYEPRTNGTYGGSNSRYSNRNDDTQEKRHVLRGTFLISLQEAEQKHLQFRSWTDMNRHLQAVLSTFVKRDLFNSRAEDRTPVFLNISMRRDTKHFQILRENDHATEDKSGDTGSDGFAKNNNTPNDEGTLAVVQIAYVSYDSKKRIIAVKAYVVCTMSSKSTFSTSSQKANI